MTHHGTLRTFPVIRLNDGFRQVQTLQPCTVISVDCTFGRLLNVILQQANVVVRLT
jgi:hypothetical protein